MSNTAITFAKLVETVMHTPIHAVTQAESAYLRIWRDRLKSISGNGEINAERMKAQLAFVPVMKLAGDITVATTVRLASVTETGGRIGLTIGTGPIGISGGFGYSSRKSEESVIQISANFVISNGEITLLDYLQKTAGNSLASADDVTNAVSHLTGVIDNAELAIASDGEEV